MNIGVEKFFDYFTEELRTMPELWSYYKFHTSEGSFDFRKAYFCQRLEYIYNAVKSSGGAGWDIGCGYGTTALFLALNGYKVHGTTLEFYFKSIPGRIAYWSQYGDVSGFTYDYEDLFDEHEKHGKFGFIIVQDTLHHLEPLPLALQIIREHLEAEGRVVVVEENGNNIIQRLKLYKQRGNKRVIEFYDERLNKTILLGNENIRSLGTWKAEMEKQGLYVSDESVQYVRAYPPFLFNRYGYAESKLREQKLWKNSALLREYFFFGVNFIAGHRKGLQADLLNQDYLHNRS